MADNGGRTANQPVESILHYLDSLGSIYRDEVRQVVWDLSRETSSAFETVLQVFVDHYKSPSASLDTDRIGRVYSELKSQFQSRLVSLNSANEELEASELPIDEVYSDLSSLIQELRANSDHMMKTIEAGLRGVVEKGLKELNEPTPKSVSKDDATNGGLFSKLKGLFGNTTSKDQVYLKADLGRDSSAQRYDPIKKRYVFQDDPQEPEEEVVKAPPPKVNETKSKGVAANSIKKTNLDDLLRPRQLQHRNNSSSMAKDKTGPKVVKTAALMATGSDMMGVDDSDFLPKLTFKDLVSKIRLEIVHSKPQQSDTPKKVQPLAEPPEQRRSPQRPDKRQEELEAAYQEVLNKLLSMPKYIQEMQARRSQTHIRKEESRPVGGSIGTQTLSGADTTEDVAIDRLEWLLTSTNSHLAGKLVTEVIDQLMALEQDQTVTRQSNGVPEDDGIPNSRFMDFVLLLVHRHKKSRSQLAEYELRTEELRFILESIHQEWVARGERLRDAEFQLVKYYMLLDRRTRETEVKKVEIEALKQAYWKEKEDKQHYVSECEKLALAAKSLADTVEKQKVQTKKLLTSLEQSKSAIESKQVDFSNFQHKLSLLEDDNHRLHKLNREVSSEKQHLKMSLEKVQSELTVLTEKYYDTIHKSNSLLDTLQGERDSGVRNLRLEKDKLMVECDRLSQELSRKDRKIRDLEEEITYVQKKSKEYEAEKDKLVQDSKSRVAILENDVTNQLAEIKRLREAISELKESSTTKTEILEEKERELAKLKKKSQEAEADKDHQIASLKANVTQIQSELLVQKERFLSLSGASNQQDLKGVPPSPKGPASSSRVLFSTKSSVSPSTPAEGGIGEVKNKQDIEYESRISELTSQLKQAYQEAEVMKVEVKALKQRLPKQTPSLNSSGSEGKRPRLFGRTPKGEDSASDIKNQAPETETEPGLGTIKVMNDLRNENFSLKAQLEELQASLQQSTIDLEQLKQNSASTTLRKSADKKVDEETLAQLAMLESEVVRLQTSAKLSETQLQTLEGQLEQTLDEKKSLEAKFVETEARHNELLKKLNQALIDTIGTSRQQEVKIATLSSDIKVYEETVDKLRSREGALLAECRSLKIQIDDLQLDLERALQQYSTLRETCDNQNATHEREVADLLAQVEEAKEVISKKDFSFGRNSFFAKSGEHTEDGRISLTSSAVFKVDPDHQGNEDRVFHKSQSAFVQVSGAPDLKNQADLHQFDEFMAGHDANSQRVEELESAKSTLEALHRELNSKYDQLVLELETSRGECARLQAELDSRTEELATAKSELEVCLEREQRLQEELNQAQEGAGDGDDFEKDIEIERLKKQVKDQDRTISQLRMKVANGSSSSKSIGPRDSSFQGGESLNSDRSTEYRNSQIVGQVLQPDKSQELQAEVDSLRQIVQARDEEINSLRLESEQSYQKHRDESASLLRELDSMNETVTQLKAVIKDRDLLLGETNRRLEEQEVELSQLRNYSKPSSPTPDGKLEKALRKKIEGLELDMNNVTSENRRLQAALVDLEAKQSLYKQRIERSSEERVNELEELVSRQKTQLDQMSLSQQSQKSPKLSSTQSVGEFPTSPSDRGTNDEESEMSEAHIEEAFEQQRVFEFTKTTQAFQTVAHGVAMSASTKQAGFMKGITGLFSSGPQESSQPKKN